MRPPPPPRYSPPPHHPTPRASAPPPPPRGGPPLPPPPRRRRRSLSGRARHRGSRALPEPPARGSSEDLGPVVQLRHRQERHDVEYLYQRRAAGPDLEPAAGSDHAHGR